MPQERLVRLLDEQLEPDRPAVDERADVLGPRGSEPGPAVHLVAERLGQSEPVHVLVDQVDRGHPGERAVLVEVDLPPAAAGHGADEVEQLRLAGRRVHVDERRVAAGRRRRLGRPEPAAGPLLHPGAELRQPDVDDEPQRDLADLELVVDVDGERRPHLVGVREGALAGRVHRAHPEPDDLPRLLGRDGRGVIPLLVLRHRDDDLVLLGARTGDPVAQLDGPRLAGAADGRPHPDLLARPGVRRGERDARDDRRRRGGVVGVLLARRAARLRRPGRERRRGPVIRRVPRRRRADPLQRRPVAVGGDRPRAAALVPHRVHLLPRGVAQLDRPLVVGERAVEPAGRVGPVEPAELLRVLADHEVAAGGERRAGRELVADRPGELPPGEVHGLVAGVVQLDELEFVEVVGGVVEDLVDDDAGAGRAGGRGQ